MILRMLAHARSGDKGDTLNISVVAYDVADFERLVTHVTAARVREHLVDMVHGDVVRHELPQLGALNFVVTGALGGGVTRSLALDAHGKSLSCALLSMEIPEADR